MFLCMYDHEHLGLNGMVMQKRFSCYVYITLVEFGGIFKMCTTLLSSLVLK